MTDEEFNVKSRELLDQVPEEFHSAIAFYAYEHGHSAGNDEVILYIDELTDALIPAIRAYTNRITNV